MQCYIHQLYTCKAALVLELFSKWVMTVAGKFCFGLLVDCLSQTIGNRNFAVTVWQELPIPIAYWSTETVDQYRHSEFPSHSHESRTKKPQYQRTLTKPAIDASNFCSLVMLSHNLFQTTKY